MFIGWHGVTIVSLEREIRILSRLLVKSNCNTCARGVSHAPRETCHFIAIITKYYYLILGPPSFAATTSY